MSLEVGGGGTEEEEEEKEKIPLCESIGHRPLWSRCPALTLNYNHDLPQQGTGTADNLTLLRLLFFKQWCLKKVVVLYKQHLRHFCAVSYM